CDLDQNLHLCVTIGEDQYDAVRAVVHELLQDILDLIGERDRLLVRFAATAFLPSDSRWFSHLFKTARMSAIADAESEARAWFQSLLNRIEGRSATVGKPVADSVEVLLPEQPTQQSRLAEFHSEDIKFAATFPGPFPSSHQNVRAVRKFKKKRVRRLQKRYYQMPNLDGAPAIFNSEPDKTHPASDTEGFMSENDALPNEFLDFFAHFILNRIP
ncbi:hypothetical protein BVRB_029730, partial [Beta vulgaris subsp. vulgaris]